MTPGNFAVHPAVLCKFGPRAHQAVHCIQHNKAYRLFSVDPWAVESAFGEHQYRKQALTFLVVLCLLLNQ